MKAVLNTFISRTTMIRSESNKIWECPRGKRIFNITVRFMTFESGRVWVLIFPNTAWHIKRVYLLRRFCFEFSVLKAVSCMSVAHENKTNSVSVALMWPKRRVSYTCNYEHILKNPQMHLKHVHVCCTVRALHFSS